jgi:xanthine dehydrogenase YagR molybdenum-binding subunit
MSIHSLSGSAWPHTWLVAQAARLVGRPVRLVLARGQMSTSVGWREEQVQRITLACDDAGQLTGIRHVKTSATSPFDDFAEPSCITAQMMYACPNVETTYRLGRINAMTPGSAPWVLCPAGPDRLAIRCLLSSQEVGVRPSRMDQANGQQLQGHGAAEE